MTVFLSGGAAPRHAVRVVSAGSSDDGRRRPGAFWIPATLAAGRGSSVYDWGLRSGARFKLVSSLGCTNQRLPGRRRDNGAERESRRQR